jgi:hypothetical protein
MFDILVSIVGEPQDDLQTELLYLGAICISVIVVFFVVYLFKVISGIISPNDRR